MSLRKYQSKRDFKKTAEPRGKVKKKNSKSRKYLIQKHAASHLHYDFRIELSGVLKSWAVPKGPSLDPSVKRLAMHVEDHPMEYGTFEGIIPKGEYGGGTVMMWDEGEWEPVGDPAEGYKKGDLKFILKGKRLKGLWKLIRLKDGKSWLLMKGKDKYAKDQADYDITLEKMKSVKTNKSMEQIASLAGRVWTGKGEQHKVDLNELKDFKFTNPDKILYKEDKITKLNIAEYYLTIKDWILPYITQRALSVVRCPEGYKQCFYQKHVNNTTPKQINSVKIKEKDGVEKCIYIKNEIGLMALTQMAVLEIHPWGSKIDDIEHPDFFVIDLDPAPDVKWKDVVAAAFDVKEHLQEYRLKSFVKTTGGKGLHVVVPIKPEYSWEQIKMFTKTFVEYLASLRPKSYVTVMTKSKRHGKIFVDYLRNQRGATAVAPYSTRAREGAPVSVPLEWDELSNNYKDTFYTIKTLPERLQHLRKDPWKDFQKLKQSLRFDE